MASIRNSIIAGFALFVATSAIGSAPAQAQLLTRAQFAAYEASKGQSRCPHTLNRSHQTVRQLSAAATRMRAMAEANPIYWADVGYYDAQLAFATSCVQSVAAIKRVAR